jgi:hypothetical protein
LIVVANLSYLRSALHEDQVLYGVLQDLERLGAVVDSRDVVPDAVNTSAASSLGAAISQRFDGETFLAGITADLREAHTTVVFTSERIGVRSAHIFATVLTSVVERGVNVRVVTKPLIDQDSGGPTGDEAATILRKAGIIIDTCNYTDCNSVVVDNEIVWIGDIPPLDCVERSELVMVRVASSVAANVLSRDADSLVDEVGDPPLVANA